VREYSVISIVLLVILVITDLRFGSGLLRRRGVWYAMALLLLMTVLFDQPVIAAGLVKYDDAFNSGIRFVYMPVEDLVFGANLYLASMMSWDYLGSKEWGGK